MTKEVALVLGSGGARGLAHIGAIEELESRGYHIHAVSGTSMGAMIAGMYAAGKLAEAKDWFLQVDKQLILKMVDLNISFNSLVKGERIITELEKVVPDCQMQDLNIPCSIVAADLMTTDEVIFRTGSLFSAIRASMSIPLFFQPVQHGKRLLVDGGLLNPLPLNRVEREQGDILVAMDISGKDGLTVKENKSNLEKAAEMLIENGEKLPDHVLKYAAKFVHKRQEKGNDLGSAVNYFSMADRMSDMQIQQNTQLSLKITPPDVYAVMPQYAYSTFDFDKAEEIMKQGHIIMGKALDEFEKNHQ